MVVLLLVSSFKHVKWSALGTEKDGLKLYVDAVALSYLSGVEIDYAQQGMGASFVFKNVFAATGGSGACSACGAGGGCG